MRPQRYEAMEWGFIIALVVAIPLILFPVAFIWYLNAGGIYHAVQDARRKKEEAQKRAAKATVN